MSCGALIDKIKIKPVDFSKANATEQEVFYHLYTKNDSDKTLHADTVASYKFEKDLPTKVFIHGWRSSIRKGNWYEGFKEAYFQKGEYNVLYVDWFVAANREFHISAANVKPVGRFIGDFLLASEIPLQKIHIIGKSLGCHVAGFAGKRIDDVTSNKIARITGLDPAAPKFEHDDVDETQRLSEFDAEFVDIVHTDAGYYGFVKPIGTVDYYPNGGRAQPGCGTDEDGHNDSHGRSNWYYLESISKKVLAKKAASWQKFLEGKFEGDPIAFGEDAPKNAMGNYYFQTNATPPFTRP